MAKKTTGIDATTLLKKDHATVKALFKEYEEASDRAWKKKHAIVETLRQELTIHTRIEEEIFYPALAALKSKDAKRMAVEAKEEHALVKIVLGQLQAAEPGNLEFDAKVKVLKDTVLHHVKEEEGEIFPQIRDGISQEDLKALGARLEARKEELQRGEGMEEEAELEADAEEEEERQPARVRANRGAEEPKAGDWA